MIDPLLQAADFKRLLSTPVLRRSAHFALHYLHGCPSPRPRPVVELDVEDLSTSHEPNLSEDVDKLPGQCWLGCVLPKRHARRAVTRNVLRRQIRAVMSRHVQTLQPGLWLVRLRGPFSRDLFPSADSPALRRSARGELERLFGLQVRTRQEVLQ